MDTLLFTQSTKDTIWAVLAAVLHLGNVAFTDKRHPDVDEVAKVANKETLAFAAKLVGCDAKVRAVGGGDLWRGLWAGSWRQQARVESREPPS